MIMKKDSGSKRQNCIEGSFKIFKATQEERMMAGYRFNKEEYFKETKRYILIIQPMFPEWKKNWTAPERKSKGKLFSEKTMDLQNCSQGC